MSNKNNFLSKQLGGVSYSLRKPPDFTWKNVVGTIASLLFMVFPFMIMNSFFKIVNPSSRKKNQASLVPKMMAGIEKEFQGEREILLGHLSGRVLDFGSGAGPYLKYCGRSDEVVAIEPLDDLHSCILENGASLKKLTILRDISEVPGDKTFDWVILGNVSSSPQLLLRILQGNATDGVSSTNR